MIEEVKIELHYNAFKNQSKGIIFYPAFKYMEEGDIMEEMRAEGVTFCRRMLQKGNADRGEIGASNGMKNSALFQLIFRKAIMPNEDKDRYRD